ncbi:MAG: FHA domain-containing protein [Planctomycetota bacterium]
MADTAGAGDYPELQVPPDKVQALEQIVSERNKIQGLLAKAEGSKGKVKEDIYARVLQDYEAKLADVAARFEPVRDAIAEALAGIRDKEKGLRTEFGAMNDELEELRFRCEVGEFDAGELAKKEQEKADELQELQAKLGAVDQTYEACKQYLGEEDFQDILEPPEPSPEDGAPPVEEVISIDDAAPPPPPMDVEIADPEGGDLDVQVDDLVVQDAAAPPPPPEPEAPDELQFGDPELTLSEPIPLPGLDGDEPFDGPAPPTGDGDVEATISFAKRSVINLIKDDGSEDTYLLGVEPLTIGRNHRNDIVLLDRSISRKHAEVKKEEDAFFITDLSSGGGLAINGEKIKRTELKPGDEISIGDFRLVFKEEMGY